MEVCAPSRRIPEALVNLLLPRLNFPSVNRFESHSLAPILLEFAMQVILATHRYSHSARPQIFAIILKRESQGKLNLAGSSGSAANSSRSGIEATGRTHEDAGGSLAKIGMVWQIEKFRSKL